MNTLPTARLIIDPIRERSTARARVERVSRTLAIFLVIDGAPVPGLGFARRRGVVEVGGHVLALAGIVVPGELVAVEVLVLPEVHQVLGAGFENGGAFDDGLRLGGRGRGGEGRGEEEGGEEGGELHFDG